MGKKIVLHSGGADSTALVYWLMNVKAEHDLVLLNAYYGSKHSLPELYCAALQAERLGLQREFIDLYQSYGRLVEQASALMSNEVALERSLEEIDGSQPARSYVPLRNVVFLSIAAGFAEAVGADEVYYAPHLQDERGYPDCTAPFVEAFNTMLSVGSTGRVKVVAPFVNKPKSEVARIGKEAGVDFSLTWSCYSPRVEVLSDDLLVVSHCEECTSCLTRKAALQDAGIESKAEIAPSLELRREVCQRIGIEYLFDRFKEIGT